MHFHLFRIADLKLFELLQNMVFWVVACPGSTVAEHSTLDGKIEGLGPVSNTGRAKNDKNIFQVIKKSVFVDIHKDSYNPSNQERDSSFKLTFRLKYSFVTIWILIKCILSITLAPK